MDLRRAAEEISASIGTSQGKRILHVTDQHNRLSSFRLVRMLASRLKPDVVVNTGDISGLGGWTEGFWIQAFCRLEVPTVFAPGNHDSEIAVDHFETLGSCCLDRPKVCQRGGLRFWGYPDPNRTSLFARQAYDSALCQAARERFWPPQEQDLPVIVAVHNELMAGPSAPGVPLILAGHFHSPKVVATDGTLLVRSGSAGGGGPFGGLLEFAVIDLSATKHLPSTVWLIRAGPEDTVVETRWRDGATS
jgi:predicted MPP superfamily phosphohydrolase